jgi:hypothetical protein
MPIGGNMETGDFGDEITGVHSAIKQFVDAKKEDEAPATDASKKKILKKILNK